jgi:hypothetical protein
VFAFYLAAFSAALVLLLNVTGGLVQRLFGEQPGVSSIARPILGLSVLVVVLHWQALVLPAGDILPVLAAGAVVLVVLLAVQPRRLPRLVDDPAASAVGALAWAAALVPNVIAHTHRIVLANSSHDAFYYTSVADWLRDHRGTQVPRLEGPGSLDAPYFGAAAQTIEYPVRYGQELLHAWFSSAIGASPSTTFASAQAVYVGLVAYAVVRLLRSVGVSGPARPLLALAVTTNPWFLAQVWAQNADAILGVALAVELITVVHLTFAGDSRSWSAPSSVLAIALLTGALIGTYFELASVVATLVLVRVLWSGRSTFLRRALLGLGCVAASALIALPAWVRGVRGALFLSRTIDNVAAEPLSRSTMLSRFSQVLPPWAPDPTPALVVVAVLTAAVLTLAVARAHRWLAVGILGTLAGIGLVVRSGDPYSFGRSLALSSVFLGATVAVAVWTWLGARRRLRALAAVLALAVVVVNGLAAAFALDWPWRDRVVGQAYLQAADWARHIGRSGRDVAVVAPRFFDELVLADGLQDRPRTSYPVLRGDLGYLATLSTQAYNVGPRFPRYVIVGPGTTWAASAGGVVHRNRIFTMIDTTKPGWVVAYPGAPVAAWDYAATRSGRRWLLLGQLPANVAVSVAPDVKGFCLRVGAPGQPAGWDIAPTSVGWSATLEGADGLCIRRSASAPTDSLVSVSGGERVALGRVPTVLDISHEPARR